MAAVGIGVVASLWCCAALAQPDPGAALRPQSARLQHVIEWSMRESMTFRTLVDALAVHHVMVWLTAGPCDRDRHRACLHPRITIAGGYRFLFVSVSDDGPERRVAGLIAHELQHAVEIAAAGITRADDFDTLYQRIGRPCERMLLQACWETTAALDIQNRVIAELTVSGRRAGR